MGNEHSLLAPQTGVNNNTLIKQGVPGAWELHGICVANDSSLVEHCRFVKHPIEFVAIVIILYVSAHTASNLIYSIKKHDSSGYNRIVVIELSCYCINVILDFSLKFNI